MEFILYITNTVAAVLWLGIFILFSGQLSLQEMKCDFLVDMAMIDMGVVVCHVTMPDPTEHDISVRITLSQGRQHLDTGPCVWHTTHKVRHVPFPPF